MWWIVFILLIFFNVFTGVRQEQRQGLWSWSKFVFALSFGALEYLLVAVPLNVLNPHARYYWPVVTTCFVIAGLNFIWMVIVARRWKLPDCRTSLQAYRDAQNGE